MFLNFVKPVLKLETHEQIVNTDIQKKELVVHIISKDCKCKGSFNMSKGFIVSWLHCFIVSLKIRAMMEYQPKCKTSVHLSSILKSGTPYGNKTIKQCSHETMKQ